MIKVVYLDHSKWNDIPYKFEAGTPDIAGSIGFGKAIDYLTSLGMENVFMHEKKLTDYALRKLLEIRDVTLYGPEDTASKTGVISFNIKGIHPHDVAQSLDREGIAVRSGFHCAMPLHQKLKLSATCRASFYIYNTFEEIDKLIIGIDKLRTFFSKS